MGGDTTIVVAVIGLVAAILVPLIAVLAGRGGTQLKELEAAYTRVVAENRELRAENRQLDKDVDDERTKRRGAEQERGVAQDALSGSMVRLGIVEAYARQLETRYGLPHYDWTATGPIPAPPSTTTTPRNPA